MARHFRTLALCSSSVDAERISASWLLRLPADHRPRLHRGLSRFLFSSNGLPFVPRLDEVGRRGRAGLRIVLHRRAQHAPGGGPVRDEAPIAQLGVV